MVLVSVLMGSYNHQDYIGEAIESVLNQTFKDLELIIVDDFSTDNSRKVIEKYQAQDPRVKAFFHKRNMGIPATSNDGLKEATGKFVSFIGSDDVWLPFKLEKQMAILRNNEDKIIWSDGIIIDGKGKPVGKTVTQLLNSPIRKSGNIFQELLTEDYIFGQSLLFKTEYLKEILFDEKLLYVNDHLFIVNLSKNHDFIYFPQPLAKYRVHGTNITLKNERTWLKERILIRKRFLKDYQNELTNRTKGDIYYKIGHAFSRLGEKRLARQYYFKAIETDYFHTNSILYLIFALTDGKGTVGEFLSTNYHKITSHIL